MALQVCGACQRFFAKRELTCPHCGNSVHSPSVPRVACCFITALVVLLVATAVGSITMLMRNL